MESPHKVSFFPILNTPIEHLIPPDQKLITIHQNTRIADAFKILSDSNIHSAPVVNYENQNSVFHGFIDLIDIVTYIVRLFEEKNQNAANEAREISFVDFLEQADEFSHQTIGKIIDISQRNPVVPLQKKSPLISAIHVFIKTNTHRVPIIEDRKVVNVLTQSSVIRYLADHASQLSDLSKLTVRELGLGLKEVVTVKMDQKAIEALKLMVDRKVSAVAVVDNSNSLVGNISAKDLKLIAPEILFSNLYNGVITFMEAIQSRRIPATRPPITVGMFDTFAQVLQTLHWSKVHRVYVVDRASGTNSPVGVISLVDALSALLLEDQQRSLK